jgi:hypothetical protein
MAVFKCTACPGDGPCILYFEGQAIGAPSVCPMDGEKILWEYLDPEAPL